jgi:hypothetical protein
MLDDDDDNYSVFCSFTCLLNSPNANYRINTGIDGNKKTKAKYKTRQLVSFR